MPTVLCAAFSVNCFAHVKWFAEPEAVQVVLDFSYTEILAASVLLAISLTVAAWLNIQGLRRGGVYCSRLTEGVQPLRVACVLLSIYFLGCAVSGFILAPHITAAPGVTYLCLGLQSLISVLLLINRAHEWIAGLMLAVFMVAGINDATFFLEYLLLAGLACLIYFSRHAPPPHLLMVLRVALGVSLVCLAFMEKLLQPQLAINVLQQFPLNFMSYLGLPFSDLWFVLAAGIVELLVGLLLILGWLVRTTILVLLGLMVASNAYFFAAGNNALAMMELVGHLPVFAAGITLIFYHCREVAVNRVGLLKARAHVDVSREQKLSVESGQ